MSKFGLRTKDFKSLDRDSFNDFLPWVAQDQDTGKILTQEGSIGYVWECQPLSFLNDKTADILTGALKLEFGESGLIQFILYADNKIDRYVEAFKNEGKRHSKILDKWTERFTEDLYKRSQHNPKMAGIPLRRYRLFVCIKNGSKEDELDEDTVKGVEESLTGANLYPRKMLINEFLELTRGILGSEASGNYDPRKPIRKQVLSANDDVVFSDKYIRIGKKYLKVLTPKVLPEKIDTLKVNELFGGFNGAISDSTQINTPFLYSVTILPKSVASGLAAKLEMMNFQRSGGSFLAQAMKRIKEYDWALSISDTTTFMRVIPSMILIADSETQLKKTTQRTKSMWDSKGALLQEERLIQKIIFLSSLPLGYLNVGNITERMDRYFIMQIEAVSRFLPVQSDFQGNWPPAIPVQGRKGQFIGLDLQSKRATNRNMLIAAASGSGKSVWTQYVLLCEYRRGNKIRVIDIGYSYKKITKFIEGVFLDIQDDFVLNPFDNAYEGDLENIKHIIAQMCYSYGGGQPDEIEFNLISESVQWAFKQNDPENGVTLVSDYLKSYPEYSITNKEDIIDEVELKAHKLSYIMREFATGGQYAKFVHGRSTIDINKDDWMVLELEALMGKPALFNVVILMVINMITKSLYLAKDSEKVPTFILFDEAWKFLKQIGESSQMVANIIEEGFRRARKYHGAFAVVTQSVKDLETFGPVGDVIMTSTQYKCYLAERHYNKAREKGIIDYDPFVMKLLTSVSTQRPRYSELFIDGGESFGIGVGRLSIDNYTYALLTSDAEDNKKISQLIKNGMSNEEAIQTFADSL